MKAINEFLNENKNIYKFNKDGILTHIKSMGKWNNKSKKITINNVDYHRNDKIGGWVSDSGVVLTKKIITD